MLPKIWVQIKLESNFKNLTMPLKEDKTTIDIPKGELAINQERSTDNLESRRKRSNLGSKNLWA